MNRVFTIIVKKYELLVSNPKFKEWLIITGLCLLMYGNLFYMHYEVYLSHYDFPNAQTTPYRPIYLWWMDIMISSLFFYIVCLGKKRLALILTYIFLSFFIVANTIYSRFFEQYLSIDVLNEASNFTGVWWIAYIPQAFRWSDLLLICTTTLFAVGIRYVKNSKSIKGIIPLLFITIIPSIAYMVIDTRVNNYSLRSFKEIKEWFCHIDFSEKFSCAFFYDQEDVIISNGILKTQVYCNIMRPSKQMDLSYQDIQEIDQYIKNTHTTDSTQNNLCSIKGTPDIAFILVESFMSVALKTTVNGKKIMPNLSALMSQDGVYSNLHVTSNKGCGESSDAQVSYFTGLLPLKSDLSVLHIIKNEMVALPQILKRWGGTPLTYHYRPRSLFGIKQKLTPNMELTTP